jgi:hypothetical protein
MVCGRLRLSTSARPTASKRLFILWSAFFLGRHSWTPEWIWTGAKDIFSSQVNALTSWTCSAIVDVLEVEPRVCTRSGRPRGRRNRRPSGDRPWTVPLSPMRPSLRQSSNRQFRTTSEVELNPRPQDLMQRRLHYHSRLEPRVVKFRYLIK